MWTPYKIGYAPKVRSISSPEGLGDRLRLVAFAERQAFHAFNEAAERFVDAPMELREAWREVAKDEARHEGWLLERLKALGQEIEEVPVRLSIYDSLKNCATPEAFALYISDAELRGQKGAEKFAEVLKKRDPETAKVFAQIALEEVAHIALVDKFFPNAKLGMEEK